MNDKQKLALYCGSAAAASLVLLQALTGRSFATRLPNIDLSPNQWIFVHDVQITWNFITLIFFVVAPFTTAAILFQRSHNNNCSETQEPLPRLPN
jgi:hypothetical protein